MANIHQISEKVKVRPCDGCVNSFIENQRLRDRCKFLELQLEEARAFAEQAAKGEQLYMQLLTAKKNEDA